MSQNDETSPKMTQDASKYPLYVLQDYRGVGWRAELPPKLISLAWGHKIRHSAKDMIG